MKECAKCGLCFEDEAELCPEDEMKIRISLPGPQLLSGRYHLTRRIGKGAMGQVYLARDTNLGTREVAVKTVRQDILSSEDLQEGEAIARFEREAMSAASVRHPNVVDVTDFGETEDGVFFLVMEYVEGETLHRLLRREGTLSIKRAVSILRQIADGVGAAHERGILHRDLKPANIFIMSRGRNKDGFVKVGDFGLAKIVNQTATDISARNAPASRGIIGTPEFMSPEQMQPELGVDARTDVYALGTIAYLMIGGRTPFTGDMMELVMQKVIHDPPPLSELRSDLPKEVESVIMSALAKDPARRPATVEDWMEALEGTVDKAGGRQQAGTFKLTILAPQGAEVYVDDERKGSIGNSGRLILSTVPAGQHILRVSKSGLRDDERVIEIREEGEEQVIQAQLRPKRTESSSKPSPSQGSSSSGAPGSLMPGIVACRKCGSRFAQGVQFCGRCGNREFDLVSKGDAGGACPRCGSPLHQNAKFCGRCGLSFSEVQVSVPVSNPSVAPENVCGRCNSRFPLNVKFCGRCGTSLG
ncbi:MAG: PEGA domain-containing protein [Acidobacteria bacterium]|nr:MAG: PEGA domain-containing protein [Acidobacteriota bacterium]REK01321.1 MAG: PEGA domain-containing protein [Acidobacteriota bacterium]REK14277.1 MAG: PEGA domain-containing protein [Acidobacteriota bacterium]REK44992.1 MAG: PEGA domain-containing protein [Acidobacteriota bacterium]